MTRSRLPRTIAGAAITLCMATILIAVAVVLLSQDMRTIVAGDIVVCLASVVLLASIHAYVDTL